MLLELINVFIISIYADTITTDPLIIGFMTVISAISGDIGLQTSSATIRIIEFTQYYLGCCGHLRRELISASVQGIVLSSVLGGIAFTWRSVLGQSNPIMFGAIVAAASLVSNVCAGVMGTITPLIFHQCGCDPTHFVGPFETTFQDIVGFLVGLSLASWLL